MFTYWIRSCLKPVKEKSNFEMPIKWMTMMIKSQRAYRVVKNEEQNVIRFGTVSFPLTRCIQHISPFLSASKLKWILCTLCAMRFVWARFWLVITYFFAFPAPNERNINHSEKKYKKTTLNRMLLRISSVKKIN